jgi:hypothetical protein
MMQTMASTRRDRAINASALTIQRDPATPTVCDGAGGHSFVAFTNQRML